MLLIVKSAGSAKPLKSSTSKLREDIPMGELSKRDQEDETLTLQQALDEIQEEHVESPYGKDKENIRPGAESRASHRPESSNHRSSKRYSLGYQKSSSKASPPLARSASFSNAGPSRFASVSKTPVRPTTSIYSTPAYVKRTNSVTSDHRRSLPLSVRSDNTNSYYFRPTGEHEVSARLPSCSSLPLAWAPNHDRLITYLATHAPLTKEGKIQGREESRERWTTKQMIELLKKRFPKLRGTKLRAYGIEERLAWLDEAHNTNDYFCMPYGAYQMEEWGRGI